MILFVFFLFSCLTVCFLCIKRIITENPRLTNLKIKTKKTHRLDNYSTIINANKNQTDSKKKLKKINMKNMRTKNIIKTNPNTHFNIPFNQTLKIK